MYDAQPRNRPPEQWVNRLAKNVLEHHQEKFISMVEDLNPDMVFPTLPDSIPEHYRNQFVFDLVWYRAPPMLGQTLTQVERLITKSPVFRLIGWDRDLDLLQITVAYIP